MYVYVYIYLYLCTYIYMYMFIYINTHTHTHNDMKRALLKYSVLNCLYAWSAGLCTHGSRAHQYWLAH